MEVKSQLHKRDDESLPWTTPRAQSSRRRGFSIIFFLIGQGLFVLASKNGSLAGADRKRARHRSPAHKKSFFSRSQQLTTQPHTPLIVFAMYLSLVAIALAASVLANPVVKRDFDSALGDLKTIAQQVGTLNTVRPLLYLMWNSLLVVVSLVQNITRFPDKGATGIDQASAINTIALTRTTISRPLSLMLA